MQSEQYFAPEGPTQTGASGAHCVESVQGWPSAFLGTQVLVVGSHVDDEQQASAGLPGQVWLLSEVHTPALQVASPQPDSDLPSHGWPAGRQ